MYHEAQKRARAWTVNKKQRFEFVVRGEYDGRAMRRLVGAKTDQESNGSLVGLWRNALLSVSEEQGVKRILVVGGADRGVVSEVRRRFSNADMNVAQWNSVVLEDFSHHGRKFDLILVDRFTGGENGPDLTDDLWLPTITSVLEPDGYLFLNPFNTMGSIQVFGSHLSRHAIFQRSGHTIVLFRPYGLGRVGEPLPEGFVHAKQSISYLLGEWEPDATNVEVVGVPGCLGLRWHYGPLWVELYTTDVQPTIEETAHTRIVLWQPITKTGRPAGWLRTWMHLNPQQHGIADIGGHEEFRKGWTEHAQRHRKKWLKDDRFEILEISFDAFAEAYHASGKLPMMRKSFLRMVDLRIPIMVQMSTCSPLEKKQPDVSLPDSQRVIFLMYHSRYTWLRSFIPSLKKHLLVPGSFMCGLRIVRRLESVFLILVLSGQRVIRCLGRGIRNLSVSSDRFYSSIPPQ
jgi:hypothetical protein